MPLRVLTVIHALAPGGIEVTLLRSLPQLRAAGVAIDLACTGPPARLDADFLAQGCTIHRIRRSAHPWRTAISMQPVLHGTRYDLVHSRFGFTSGGHVLGARWAGVPALVSIHNTAPSRHDLAEVRGVRHLHAAWIRWHRRLVDRHAALVLGHSTASLDVFEPAWRASPERYRRIYNGVSLPEPLPDRGEARRALGAAPHEEIVLHVGSMRPEKNHGGLLRLFAALHRRRPNTRLWLVGDGRLRPAVEAEIARLGLASACRLWGVQHDPWPFYRAADVFVFPSVFEGFGNVLVEAQAADLPIVVSDTVPFEEAVCPVWHPWVFPLADPLRGARGVEELLEGRGSDEAAARLRTARAFAAGFSMETMTAELVAVYREVLAGAARR